MSRRLSDMNCTVIIWRSWVRTPVGSNLGCVVLLSSYLNKKYVYEYLTKKIHTYTQTLRKIWVPICNHYTRLTINFTYDLMPELVTCKHRTEYGHTWHWMSWLRLGVLKQHVLTNSPVQVWRKLFTVGLFVKVSLHEIFNIRYLIRISFHILSHVASHPTIFSKNYNGGMHDKPYWYSGLLTEIMYSGQVSYPANMQ